MGDEKPKEEKKMSASVAEILRERERLSKKLQEDFQREVTILFTDICGYTKYMDTRGDIDGMAMIQRHNDIVMPRVEKFEGKVIKTIGDAVMASFPSPLQAVKSAIAIQEGLEEHNSTAESGQQIKVKIGVNTGAAIVDDTDLFGDAVNVASRIQSQAGADEILISKSVYDRVGQSEDLLCRWHGNVKVKGKTQALELFRVVWRDDDMASGLEAKVRTYEPSAAAARTRGPIKVIQIEITRKDDNLEVSAYEHLAGESGTIRDYEKISASMNWIEKQCNEMVQTLNSSNRKGRLTREVLVKLRELGKSLYDAFFTDKIKKKLESTDAAYLTFNIDDQLVHIPLELMHTGRQFLCQRFSIGRLVKTQQTLRSVKTRALAKPLKMLALADPNDDLGTTRFEIEKLRDQMTKQKDLINLTLRTDEFTREYFREKLKNFDIVHFAGHADYNSQNPADSRIIISGGSINADDITQMGSESTMPALIFSNACQTARTDTWTLDENFQNEIFGLANAFLVSGVKHYIGTFWEVLDEPSSFFSLEFYRYLFEGSSIGEAMRLARESSIKEFGEETVVWASYILYGDPTFNYMDHIQLRGRSATDEASVEDTGVKEKPSQVQGTPAVQKGMKPSVKFSIAAAVLLFIIASVMFWGYPGLFKKDTTEFETAAMQYYKSGNFDQALAACEKIDALNAQARLPNVIRGNIFLTRGILDDAQGAYDTALQARYGTDIQKADALIGLGRIASIRKNQDAALGYYRQATDVAPQYHPGYMSQAVILQAGGKYDESYSLLEKAQKIAPDNQVVAALAAETRKKLDIAQNKEKQERIDKLVQDLIETMTAPPRAEPGDGWTSRPMTLWIMDMDIQGYSLNEGEGQLLTTALMDRFLENQRFQVVERAILDKLLGELKIATSNLADRRTALSLGKILAARIILTGKVIHSGPQTQVSMRAIETETGRILMSVTEDFTSSDDVSLMTEKIGHQISEKLEQAFPLRGKIADVSGQDIQLNIGTRVGAASGQKFRVIGEDIFLEIISVQPDSGLAKIDSGKAELKTGLRVEAIKEG